MSSLQRHSLRAAALLERYRLAESTAGRERAGLDSARKLLTNREQARVVLQQVAEAVQNTAHARIAGVVTRCLKAVFGEGAYEFQIKFVRARGKTEARLCFVRDGQEYEPTFASGGGVVDVASFALRLACLLLSRPRLRKLLVLDEPLKHLSSEYREAAGEMLLEVAKELGVQILMVTHSVQLCVGRVVEL